MGRRMTSGFVFPSLWVTSTVKLEMSHRSASSTATDSTDKELLSSIHFNIEGFTSTKWEVLEIILSEQKLPTVILLQKTHIEQPSRMKLSDIPSKHRGLAIIVKEGVSYNIYATSQPGAEIEWRVIQVDRTNSVNVYKPPATTWMTHRNYTTPCYPGPMINAGDFNSHHYEWGYKENCQDGEKLVGWSHLYGLALFFHIIEAFYLKNRQVSGQAAAQMKLKILWAKTESQNSLPWSHSCFWCDMA